jgi:hypothetical protein
MLKQLTQLLQICAITAVATSAHAAAIGFEGIGEHGTPFTLYTEDGFMVFPGGGEEWVNNTVYGKPAPSVVFNRPRGAPELWAGMFIRAEGTLPFTFSAVDLYSSVTPIPYRFVGYKDGMPVLIVFGEMPNPFGEFEPATNPDFETLIDLLYIELVNPFVAFGGNPVGFDNIVVSLANLVPEPATGGLLFAGVAAIAAARVRRRHMSISIKGAGKAPSAPTMC